MIKEILSAVHNGEDFDNILWTYKIVCKLQTFPGYIYGLTYRSSADVYHIFINEALNEDKRKETILHELEHIELGHFNTGFARIVDIYYEEQADNEAQKIIKDLL